ncbi:DNA-directed RNA polymerase I subunit RPA12 [Nematocida displodere]|uniref:DNA-directed RNA polymerase I subunit RPA12 n=1 Tax=Nematocida displodere TaxID=1805483 RepID=A0A177EIA6_9MICR|nr:DNA-directed RNA polymerase I subunit RPA12 [Nematocida displodere]
MLMFCGSCEKYLSPLESTCRLCGKSNKIVLNQCINHSKTYVVKNEVQPKKKGAKIKEECPECGSDYLYYYTMQLRSADEGQTVFYECDCGYKAKLNT